MTWPHRSHPLYEKFNAPIHAPTAAFVGEGPRFAPFNDLARSLCRIACVAGFERWQLETLRDSGFRVEVRPS